MGSSGLEGDIRPLKKAKKATRSYTKLKRTPKVNANISKLPGTYFRYGEVDYRRPNYLKAKKSIKDALNVK